MSDSITPPRRNPSFASLHAETIHARYPHESAADLAVELGCPVSTLRNAAKQLGVKSLNWQARRVNTLISKDYGIRTDYFSQWSDETAYILGYIWADGSIGFVKGKPRSLRLGCTTTDEALIITIASRIRPGGSHVYHHPGTQDGSGHGTAANSRIDFCSIRLATALVERHKIMPRKSFLDSPFPEVPEQFLRHFVRGHFDGDGCAIREGNRTRLELLATISFLITMRDRIAVAASVSSPNLTRLKSQYLYSVRWSIREEVATLYRWLYPPGCTLWLDRKKVILSHALEPNTLQHRTYTADESRGIARRPDGSWQAYPGKGRRRISLGTYRVREEAMLAVNVAYEAWYGQAALLNPISPGVISSDREQVVRDFALHRLSTF